MKKAAADYFLKKLQKQRDVQDRVVFTDFDPQKVKRVHFTGICGKAMASLAGLFVKAGYIVTGSDESWNPPMSTVLEHLGITFKPFSSENIKDVDLVVMGNAYSPSNIEAVAARQFDIAQTSSAEAYGTLFIKNTRSIVITGTHGKTTTASIATQIFFKSKKPIVALVGGIVRNIGESYVFSEQPQYSIVEGDEYDTAYFDKAPKFLHYRPTIGVITSIEFDHADIYDDMNDYVQAFIFFAQEIPDDGYLLISEDVEERYRNLLKDVCAGKTYVYGQSEISDIKATNIRIDPEKGGQLFDVEMDNSVSVDFFTPMFGNYNIKNSLVVVAIALLESLTETDIKKSLASFSGAEQRQQILFDNNGIVLIDDFAHHPTAVECTLAGVRDHYPDKRIIAVFEPRSATSRRKDFEELYVRAFKSADIAFIAKPILRSVDDPKKIMNIDVVASGIKSFGTTVFVCNTTSKILEKLKETITNGDVVVVMSNGHFDGLSKKTVSYLTDFERGV